MTGSRNGSGGAIFRLARPASYRVVLSRHLVPALVSGLFILACYIPFDKLPWRICVFNRATGYPCPTCGWTRGFMSAARGDWAAVLYDCPFALIPFMILVFVFMWNAAGLMFGLVIERGRLLMWSWKKAFITSVVLAAMIAINWLYRLAMGFD